MKELKYLELIKNNKIEELKKELEEAIRIGSIPKTTKTTVVNSIKRMFKENDKKGRSNLNGYVKDGDLYYFSNSYLGIALKDSLGYEALNTTMQLPKLIENLKDSSEVISIDELNNIIYSIKTKENYIYNNVQFNYNHLKYCVDSIQDITSVRFKENGYTTAITLENDKGEFASVLPLR